MQSLREMHEARARRPYWLLLALALFFAGQIVTASHWHNDGAQVGDGSALDSDCALCALSSATGAALLSAALIIAGIALASFILFDNPRAFIAPRTSAFRSRAPPLYS